MAGWEDLEPASVQPDGGDVVLFPVESISKTCGNRLVPRERPYRDGEKQDTTGTRADTWKVVAKFAPGITEPGMGDGAMWPDRINALETALKSQRTLTLHLLWERNIRCKASDFERSAVSDDLRDGERISVTFKADNEDAIDGSTELVSVRAAVRQKLREAIFDAEREGMSMPLVPTTFDGPTLDETIDNLHQMASDLEEALSAPEDYRSDVEGKAKRLGNACRRFRESFETRVPGRDQGNDPQSEASSRKLREVEELCSQAEAQARAGRPRKVRKTYAQVMDIYTIAALEQQNPDRLVDINGHLEDMMAIGVGRVVYIEVQP